MDLTRFWMVEEEKFTTESKYPSIGIDKSIATKKRLWRYLYKEGIWKLQTQEQWKTPFLLQIALLGNPVLLEIWGKFDYSGSRGACLSRSLTYMFSTSYKTLRNILSNWN